MKVESQSNMRPLIADRSSQQATQRFVSTWPQIWSKSVEISDCDNACRPSRPPHPTLILLFSAIVLAIATIIDVVFELKSRGFGDFNAGFNVFNNEINNECELGKRGLSIDEYASLCHHTSDIASPPNDTVFNFGPTGVGLREIVVNGYLFDVLLNENKFYCGVNNVFDGCLNENFYDNDISNVYYFVPPGIEPQPQSLAQMPDTLWGNESHNSPTSTITTTYDNDSNNWNNNYNKYIDKKCQILTVTETIVH